MVSRNKKLIDHNQTILSFSITEDEETVVVLSPKIIEHLENKMSHAFDHVQHSMNPVPSIQRRKIMQSGNFDMHIYIQPSRIFDVKRFWNINSKKKTKTDRRNNMGQIKVCPETGFTDILKPRRKCYLKMPSVPGQPFVRIYDDSKYIPPTTTSPPPHILSAQRSLWKFSDSSMLAESNVDPYMTPCSPKLKIKTKLKPWPPRKIFQDPDGPKELFHEKYTAPPGAKENYSCSSVTDIKAADKALEAVSIFMNNSSRVLPFPDITNCPGDLDEEHSSSALHPNNWDNWENDSIVDTDGEEWTKLHPVSSSFFSESDDEKDEKKDSITEPISQKYLEKNLEKASESKPCPESEILSEIEGKISFQEKNDSSSSLESLSQVKNVIMEIININMDKPQTVQVLEESIGENIVPLHGESGLDPKYPPEISSQTSEEVEENIAANIANEAISFVQLKLRHEKIKDFRSQSCCSLRINPDHTLVPDNSTIAVSDTCLNVKKNVASPKSSKKEKRVEKKLHRFRHHPVKLVNSIDELLRLQETNPVGFYVLRTLCSKQLELHENEGCSHQEGELAKSRIDRYHHRRKILSTFCQAILLANDQGDEGYLGSEEDEEYKSQMMKDFWPIRSQCTKRPDSQNSSSMSVCDEGHPKRDKLTKKVKWGEDLVLIDYDDYEHWSWISDHEQLFSQSDQAFSNWEAIQNSKTSGKPHNIHKLQVSPEIPVGCKRCMFKIWKWCLDSLI